MKKINSSTVIIVGAGLSGICMGITLKKMGIDFLILEKSNEVSGTWNENRYPGCGCDTPMFAYCYSFELFQGEAWPKQPEILAYYQHCVNKYEIGSNIRFNATVRTAKFNKETSGWELVLENGDEFHTRFLVNATGQLNTPAFPAIEGMDSFSKKLVHSAEYPETMDVDGKKIAIIGNAATTLQIVQALQPKVAELLVFARSSKYVYPRVKYSPITIKKMIADHEFWQQVRQQFIDSQDQYRSLLDSYPDFDPYEENSKVREFYAQSSISDFDEYEKYYDWMVEKGMRPDYPTGCSRPLASDTYHQAIRESNVKLIEGSVELFTENSIISNDQEYDVDGVILATGFKLNNLIPPYEIVGSDSVPLSTVWSEKPDTYLGISTKGCPNLFFLYGPNTNTNATAVTFYVESQVNYIAQIMQQFMDKPFDEIEVKQEILEDYSRWIAEKNQTVSEAYAQSSANSASYYHNQDNINISTFPGCYREYESLTKNFKASDYRIESNAPLQDSEENELVEEISL